ncbi:MAG: GntR family transcriptional regulator [Terriglobia bacterium]
MPQNAYDVLLERILLGEYAPGTSLVEQDVAKELGVSRTPVREALLRLKLEGLVKIIPRGGNFVAEASLRQVREVTEVRLILEGYLSQLVVERRTEKWLAEVRSWLKELEGVWPSLSSTEWMKKDLEFHHLMDKAVGSEVLSNHLWLLRRQAVLFWGQSADGRASLQGIITDFNDTLRAITDRDTDKCIEILHRHVLAHVERIQKYMKPELYRPSVLPNRAR